MGGYTFLQIPLRLFFRFTASFCHGRGWRTYHGAHISLSRVIAAFCSAWLSLQLLNNTKKQVTSSQQHTGQEGVNPGIIPEIDPEDTMLRLSESLQAPLAGRTIDLTLFAVTRAIETVIGDMWSRYRTSRSARNKWTRIEAGVSHLTDAGVFSISAGVVMWAWFYLPDRLPRAYNIWIREAAQVDHRLLKVLRKARGGTFVYGRETGQASILESMCKDYGWPLVWGDPAETVPIPCEMVHMGAGKSCHWHAAVRFARAFKFALATYLPLQLLVKARNPSIEALRKACRDALRSSAFLGGFIGLFYYGVCLSRTQLGPKIFSSNVVSSMMWDQGLCIGTGCALCGFSILIEGERRRQEVAMFVAPRAFATTLPRRYDRKVCLVPGYGAHVQKS